MDVYNKLADSLSRNKRQCACSRKIAPGQATDTGPCNAALTASALRFSGTMHIIFFAAQSAGMVSVSAYDGTDSRLGKYPSPTCWRLQVSSSLTILTERASLKSATAGSLKAKWPFSPMPRQQRSIG